MEVVYRCPTCHATKSIVKNPDITRHEFLQGLPEDVPCGVRGCMDRATRQKSNGKIKKV